MKKYILVFLVGILLASCNLEKNTTTQEEPSKAWNEVIQTTASIIPLASVINAIGWEFVQVHTIIPAGVSPHGFDLSARDAVAVEKSDITFLLGLEQIDGFLEKPLQDKKHVELAQGMQLLEAAAHDHSDHEGEEHSEDTHEDEHEDDHEDEEQHDEDEHEDEHHDEHNVDAHVWLGEENIYQIAWKIRNELVAIMPEQANVFNANTEIFTEKVSKIYEDFRETHTWKTAAEFIVFHDAYNYLMQSANIDPDLKIPFSENVLHESGTAHMVELIKEIELHGIKNLFSEPQFSDGNLQSFAQQYNLTVAILDPLGTDPSANGYIENLQKNLDNISIIYE